MNPVIVVKINSILLLKTIIIDLAIFANRWNSIFKFWRCAEEFVSRHSTNLTCLTGFCVIGSALNMFVGQYFNKLLNPIHLSSSFRWPSAVACHVSANSVACRAKPPLRVRWSIAVEKFDGKTRIVYPNNAALALDVFIAGSIRNANRNTISNIKLHRTAEFNMGASQTDIFNDASI